MSRIGNKAITIPAGVEITISSTNEVTVKGPKGTLARQFSPLMDIKVEEGILNVARQNEQKHTKQLHGTTRALINNMVVGVSEGFVKELELIGIGFKANLKGKVLELIVGYSHPINIEIEDGLTCEVPSQTEVKISGIDKQRVGECAANIRAVRKPEPYKGKGIRYKGEYVRRKEGKTAAKKA
ncbi:large subunit ribosomal protein L6 [Breznakia sp. PF5-3]|uniref:50S ribosomal protein L6 n=1 Tax=unclassified Breznakia TaxID=2623764 RepID=UPI0024053B59|nr:MULTISPECIES: 50S ribosomal protein L6 [unclassified Breznakia]MDL2276632.1 50S ribosomal protein L6 [Breznakia sp. OttesenSCG-928-G09]MDF9825156.1 large subunit ribosomal protein L6 [Breznakia sp. PM6-1]MDF9835985.1 large subunit ribosomal protein L6 [Breznakia sp. PF5-3]MDF9838083.1 large subunit ribosomal protein L6 [Breznakia sp. PFB2-8]MDF9860087.1 large subunit ribosomal protein L6 [Breznakia sp. PH5-24]